MQSMDDIYQKYARTVYKYLLTLVHNENVAEELTQETFYQAIRCIDKYNGKIQYKKGFSIDINSSYPTIMFNKKLPN